MHEALSQRTRAWARIAFATLPAPFRVGFTLLAVGAVADIGYHAIYGLQQSHTHGRGFDLATAIHVLVAAGMLVTLAGLVHAAIRSTRSTDNTKEAL